MLRKYNVVEPHPTPATTYIHTGRGGAGNIVKSKEAWRAEDAQARASISSTAAAGSKRQPATFQSGRGGAGNAHPMSERAIFSFDEELEQQMKQERGIAPVYNVGRGGAGNYVYIDGSTRRRSSETGSARSTGSAESGADAMNKKVRQSLEKRWNKFVGVGNYMIG